MQDVVFKGHYLEIPLSREVNNPFAKDILLSVVCVRLLLNPFGQALASTSACYCINCFFIVAVIVK